MNSEKKTEKKGPLSGMEDGVTEGAAGKETAVPFREKPVRPADKKAALQTTPTK